MVTDITSIILITNPFYQPNNVTCGSDLGNNITSSYCTHRALDQQINNNCFLCAAECVGTKSTSNCCSNHPLFIQTTATTRTMHVPQAQPQHCKVTASSSPTLYLERHVACIPSCDVVRMMKTQVPRLLLFSVHYGFCVFVCAFVSVCFVSFASLWHSTRYRRRGLPGAL